MTIRCSKFMISVVCLSLAASGCRLPMIGRGPAGQEEELGNAQQIPKELYQGELSAAQAAQACIATAEQLHRAGHLREAIAMYERGRQRDSQATNYARRLSVLYDKVGDANRARAEYHRALQRDPKNADLLNDFGYFHFRQGRLQAAETHLRRAIDVDSQHQRAWINLGIVLAHQGRNQESFDAFARIVGPAAAHSNVGAVMAKQGRIQEAQLSFSRALAIDPSLRQPRAFLDYFSHLPRSKSPL